MPKAIHDRAMRLLPEMERTYPKKKAKQVAFAVATQQKAAASQPSLVRGTLVSQEMQMTNNQKEAQAFSDLMERVKQVGSDPRVIGGVGGAALGGVGAHLATRGMKDKRKRRLITAGSALGGAGLGAGAGELFRRHGEGGSVSKPPKGVGFPADLGQKPGWRKDLLNRMGPRERKLAEAMAVMEEILGIKTGQEGPRNISVGTGPNLPAPISQGLREGTMGLPKEVTPMSQGGEMVAPPAAAAPTSRWDMPSSGGSMGMLGGVAPLNPGTLAGGTGAELGGLVGGGGGVGMAGMPGGSSMTDAPMSFEPPVTTATTGGSGGRATGQQQTVIADAPMTPTGGLNSFDDVLYEVQERAFQQAKAKYAQYAQENRGPYEGMTSDVDRVRKRELGALPTAGAAGAGIYGAQRLAAAAKERVGEQFATTGEIPRGYKSTILGRDIKHLGTPVLRRRAGRSLAVGVGKYVAAPLAAITAAKALFGRKPYGDVKQSSLSMVLKQAQASFMERHPGLTAAGGAAVGGVLGSQLGRLGDLPSIPGGFSTGGALAGGGLGYYLSRRAQRGTRQAEAERNRKKQMALMRRSQGAQSPFGQ